MKVIITDEELSLNRLKKYEDNIASFAGYVDKKVGFTTKLMELHYDPLMYQYELEVRDFNLASN